MRPDRLEVEGFTAFRDKAVVDFNGADLFAFVGPTGSGKSSLVDAILFALYGVVPHRGQSGPSYQIWRRHDRRSASGRGPRDDHGSR